MAIDIALPADLQGCVEMYQKKPLLPDHAGDFLADFFWLDFFEEALAFPDDFAVDAVGACADDRPDVPVPASRAELARAEAPAARAGPYRGR